MSAARPRPGLGRGLGDLIHRTDPDLNQSEDSAGLAPAGARFEELQVTSIRPNPKQPRQVFDAEALAELVDSILEVGLLQPVVVRPLPDDQYELVMGERRLRASIQAGRTTIPAIIRPTEEHELLRDALLENLHRAQLNPLEEAAAYQQLLADFGCTQEELSQRIKRSRPQISNTIRLLQLPAPVQRRVAAGVLSAGHARAILMLPESIDMERMAQRVVAENLSVRAVEELVAIGEAGPKRAPRSSVVRELPRRAEQLVEDLSERLETKVSVLVGAKNRGRVVIEFAGEDDLERIASLLNGGSPA
ncbi:MAG: ParB/RepB/Spo0J family partition protein [Micropruina sp.]|nr:ParB/RepB/Spo0J family partition protein [Micropruina sp.]